MKKIYLLNIAAYVLFLCVNKVLYAGVISMEIPLALFTLLNTGFIFQLCCPNKSAFYSKYQPLIWGLSLIVLVLELGCFVLSIPSYSVNQARCALQSADSTAEIRFHSVMGTKEGLTPFVKKGYVFSKEGEFLFFNPVSGESFTLN
ncbi:MAG: hypothetical protein Q4F17_07600 [Eubacteriales bacterium]|nr:hypothetical protein [Eubacteriales bacterium]